MAHDELYDAYEVTNLDGTQLLATANTIEEARLAARVQIEDGHVACQYGPAGFARQHPVGVASRSYHTPGIAVVVREHQGDVWVVVPA
jgi:hypothetical protein